ncbi:hypothetical protein LMIY3S_04536 [Labrys miyagiensis]
METAPEGRGMAGLRIVALAVWLACTGMKFLLPMAAQA